MINVHASIPPVSLLSTPPPSPPSKSPSLYPFPYYFSLFLFAPLFPFSTCLAAHAHARYYVDRSIGCKVFEDELETIFDISLAINTVLHLYYIDFRHSHSQVTLGGETTFHILSEISLNLLSSRFSEKKI